MRRLEAATECRFLVSLQLLFEDREVVDEVLHAGGSVADWLGKPVVDGRRGGGSGRVGILVMAMAAMVAVVGRRAARSQRRPRLANR